MPSSSKPTSQPSREKSHGKSSKVLSVSPVGGPIQQHPIMTGKNSGLLVSQNGFGLSPGSAFNMGIMGSANVTPQHNFKRDASKQTLASDALQASESSLAHRENIKLFAFKPGGVKHH